MRFFKQRNKETEDDILSQFTPNDDNNTNLKMLDVYQAMHFIFSDIKHHGYYLQSFIRVGENEYEVTISDGYKFKISNETFETIPVKIADEFNRHFREDICHFI